MHRLLMWFFGLVLYGVASGLKVTAYNLGPLSVLGSVFSTTLAFNLVFSRWLLKEQLTHPKIASAVTIGAGAIVCTVSAPTSVPTVFTPDDIAALYSKSQAAFVDLAAVPAPAPAPSAS